MAEAHLLHLWPKGHSGEVPLKGANADIFVCYPDILNLAGVAELHWYDKAVGTLDTAFLLMTKVGGNVMLDLVVEVAECIPIDWYCCRRRQWILKRLVQVHVEVVMKVGVIGMDAIFWFERMQHWFWNWTLLYHISP